MNNAVAESFFRSIKAELIRKTVFKSVNDMRKRIDDYIVLYNTIRPHNKLNGKTPDQFEKEYFDNVSD